MLLFLLLLMIYNCDGLPYNNILKNSEFSVNIKNNGLLLDNKYNINFNSFLDNRNKKTIMFDEFIYSKDYSISTITARMNNVDFLYEITDNKTIFINSFKKFSKYENNKLYISIYINKKYDDLDLDFSIDTFSILDNLTINIDNKFMIEFDEHCIVDGYDDKPYLTKLNNKYHIHFPSFNKNLYYQFVISSTNNNNSYNYLYYIIIFLLYGFYLIKNFNN